VVNAVDRLVARSFVAKTSDEYGGSLAIHPLIQQRARADLERDENAAMQTRRLAVYVVTSSFVFDAADTGRNYERHILAHVEFCAAVFASDGMEEDDRSRRAAYDLAQVYDRLHVPQKARSLYARAVRGVRNNSITIMELKMFAAFANNLSLQGEYDEALKWYARALEGTERRRGVESRGAVDIVKDMATIYAQQGKYDKAIEERRKVLAILEKPLKKNYTAILDAKYRIALVLVEQRKYDDALQLLHEVKDGREDSKLMGPEHSATLETRLAIAKVLDRQDKFADAIEEYKGILTKQRDALGELSHASIDSIDAIAALYERQGMYEEALTWYGNVLEGLPKLLCVDEDGEEELHHPWMLSTASRMGDIYVRLGTYFDAEKLYRKAYAGFQALGKGESREAGNWVLHIQEEGGDFEVPGEFQTAVNLGRVLRHKGQYEEALSWSQIAEAGLEKNLGADHPATLSSKAIIASILVAQGKYAQALKLYQLVLEHYKVSSGLQHPETLATICGLAGVFAKQGLYDKAAHYYQQAAAGQRQLLGPEHPQTLATVQGQADVYYDTGNHVEALARYVYVAAARQELLGPEHPDTLHVVYSKTFASLLSGTSSLPAVLLSFETVLRGWEKVLGPDHPWVTLAHHGIGSTHRADKAYELALQSFRRSLAGCQKSLGPTHPWTYRASCGVAGMLCKKKQYDEAEKLYRQALAGLKDSLGSEHPLTCEAMYGIAGLLKKRRKGKEAMGWYRAAAEGHGKTFGEWSEEAARSRKEVKRVKWMRWVGYVVG
jgi:tetratricopeptide (TPR) repeat protein